jgi:hypothetical protein
LSGSASFAGGELEVARARERRSTEGKGKRGAFLTKSSYLAIAFRSLCSLSSTSTALLQQRRRREALLYCIDSRKAKRKSASSLPSSKLRLGALLLCCRRLTLLAHLPHLPQRLDEVVTELLRARVRLRVLRLDSEFDDFVAGEVCRNSQTVSVIAAQNRGNEDAQLIPYPSGQIVPNPVPKKRSPALNPLVDNTHS